MLMCLWNPGDENVKNAPDKTKVSAIWYYDDGDPSKEDPSIPVENPIYTENTSTPVSFSLTAEGFLPGDYRVELLFDDEVKTTVHFKVQ